MSAQIIELSEPVTDGQNDVCRPRPNPSRVSVWVHALSELVTNGQMYVDPTLAGRQCRSVH